MSARVSAAAVTQAGGMPNDDLVRPEWVTVGAVGRRMGDPPAVRRLHQFAQHDYKPKAAADGQRGNASVLTRATHLTDQVL